MTNQDQTGQGQPQPTLSTIAEDLVDIHHAIASTAEVLGSTVLSDAAARMVDLMGRLGKLATALEAHHTLLEQDANDTRAHTVGLVQDIKDQTEKHVTAIMQDGATKVDGTLAAATMLKKILNDLRPDPALPM